MQILCMTTSAAGSVVSVLIDARLQPGLDFQIATDAEFNPPIAIVVTVPFPADIGRALEDIEDATIE